MTPVRTLNPVTDNHFTLSDLSSMKNIDFSTGNYIPDPFPTGIPIQRMLKKYNRSELRHDRLTSPPDRKDKIAKNIYKDHTQNINTSVRYYSRRKNMMDYLTQLMNFYHNEMQKHQQDAGLLLFTAENHLSFTKRFNIFTEKFSNNFKMIYRPKKSFQLIQRGFEVDLIPDDMGETSNDTKQLELRPRKWHLKFIHNYNDSYSLHSSKRNCLNNSKE
ncbi:hypothetical protein RhiirA4_424108 [Rhizophagus irregularis]|uniref:Uncharacterized protein n=1 Tax=Rhizophagus irregularis TaxID=588596 RepID=A0A2I1GWB1_9GLOM|nr:hypothetical protein RhiirA4_424108 [Rhizophagus irregularis]